jgi:DNA-binding NtrC family response regulator
LTRGALDVTVRGIMNGDGSRAAVLVVDDEEGIRDVLSFVLTRDGLRVVTANGAIDALAQFAARKFDLVITDMMMPEMNGLELIDRLRALDPAVAIIMSTGYATPEVTSACGERTVQLLCKPCDLDELRLAIRGVFAGAAGAAHGGLDPSRVPMNRKMTDGAWPTR